VATDTQWPNTCVLDEAAAIVEAEWIRLQQDEALWERELADLPADLPAPRPGPPRVGATTTRAAAATPTAATQPSPVAGAAMARDAGMGDPTVSSVTSREPAERHCRTREVMPPPTITSRQPRPVPATMTPMSRHRCRLQRPESVDARTATGGGMSKWTRAPRRCDARAGRRTAAGSVLRPPGPLAHNALVILLSAAQAS